jgi:hypothetical protein
MFSIRNFCEKKKEKRFHFNDNFTPVNLIIFVSLFSWTWVRDCSVFNFVNFVRHQIESDFETRWKKCFQAMTLLTWNSLLKINNFFRISWITITTQSCWFRDDVHGRIFKFSHGLHSLSLGELLSFLFSIFSFLLAIFFYLRYALWVFPGRSIKTWIDGKRSSLGRNFQWRIVIVVIRKANICLFGFGRKKELCYWPAIVKYMNWKLEGLRMKHVESFDENTQKNQRCRVWNGREAFLQLQTFHYDSFIENCATKLFHCSQRTFVIKN